MTQKLTGKIIDIPNKKIFDGEVEFDNGKIISVKPINNSTNKPINYLLPGFIDSHVHVESSMLVPSEFAKLSVVHGTVATISDPHEIANVCGMEGVEYMIANGKTVPFKFHFGAPSCVPATIFETAGAALNSDDVDVLLQKPEIIYFFASAPLNPGACPSTGLLYFFADAIFFITSSSLNNTPGKFIISLK